MPLAASRLDKVDIFRLAAALGIQAERPQKERARALCPFHAESTPSFILFGATASREPHYHCFGCQAHGSPLDLIIGRGKATSYRDAFLWLEDSGFLERSPTRSRDRAKAVERADAIRNLMAAAGRNANADLLRSFAESRGFTGSALKDAGILAVDLNNALRDVSHDEVIGAELVQAGIARRGEHAILGEEIGSVPLTAFVGGKRIVIPLHDLKGGLVGLLARASDSAQEPKYKYPTGFRKGQHLYQAHLVAAGIRGQDGGKEPVDLYLVEGVFDALRLRSIGLNAVASFGTAVTAEQLEQIAALAQIANEHDRQFRLHVFFDPDRAGRRGTARALPRLLKLAADHNFLLDVIQPPGPVAEHKDDPDTLISNLQKGKETFDPVAWARPALHVLVADLFDHSESIELVEKRWEGLDWPSRFMARQRLAQRLKDINYRDLHARIRPDLTSFGAEVRSGGPDTQIASDLLTLSVSSAPKSSPAVRKTLSFEPAHAPTVGARLAAAMELAREAANSREYPVDVGSWERLQQAAAVFIPLLERRLQLQDAPIRPFAAHYIPRSNGLPRLKCGPCPEDAVLQQYVLTELLRPHADPLFLDAVPAVRWWPATGEITTTGRGDPGGETVSFAYQIDMSALEGRPDRRYARRDMFRPFIDCWNAYIAFVARRIARMPGDIVYLARLDITRFYDEIPRRLVERRLTAALRQALEVSGIEDVAEPLVGGALSSAQRAEAVVDWLMAHSFGDPIDGYTYVDPIDGSVERWEGNGRGLPQGPPLSAYLATIALFGLDQRLATEVKVLDERVVASQDGDGRRASRYGAVYARYVDDLIVAAPTESQLRHLLACIEEELGRAGLRLNAKSEVLLPKTKAEAREWLVERRGAGFREYGATEELPAPVTDMVSSWGDAPDLDRRSALAILIDPLLDDPIEYKTTDAVLARLKTAAVDQLRHTDHGHFARRLWLRLVFEQQDQRNAEADVPRKLATRFHDLWCGYLHFASTQPEFSESDDDRMRDGGRRLANSEMLVAVFDGIERMLLGRPERNPQLAHASRNRIRDARRTFLEAVRNGLLDEVRQLFLKDVGEEVLKFQIAQNQIILEERADQALRDIDPEGPVRPASSGGRLSPFAAMDLQTPASLRLEAGWQRLFGRNPGGACLDVFEKAVSSSQGGPWTRDVPLVAMHAAISLVQAFGQDIGAGEQGVLEGLEDDAAELITAGLPQALAVSDLGSGIHCILKVWFPPPQQAELEHCQDPLLQEAGDDETIWQRMAAISFCLLLKGTENFAQRLRRRTLITKMLVADAGASLIPQPPVKRLPGLFFLSQDKRTIIAVRLDGEDDGELVLPKCLDNWTHQGDDKAAGFVIHRWRAVLPDGFRFLLPPDGTTPEGFSAPHIAALFEALKEHVHRDLQREPEHTLLTSAFAILCRYPLPDMVTVSDVGVVAWRMELSDVRHLAFPRYGRGLIAARTVDAAGDWIWRIGTALSTLAGLGTESVADQTSDDVPMRRRGIATEEALKRKALGYLRGAHLPPGTSAADLDNGLLPKGINRVLRALRDTASHSSDAPPASTILHFVEGRAMMTRKRIANAVEEAAGGAVGILALIGSSTLRIGDELFDDAEDDARSSGLSRPVQAFMRAGMRLWTVSHAAGNGDRTVLMIAATGIRLHALTIAWRELALALLARFDKSTRQALLELRPILGTWALPGSIFLISPKFAGLSDATAADFEAEYQMQELQRAILQAFSATRMVDARAELDRITLLGWVLVTAIATGLLPMQTKAGVQRPVLHRLKASAEVAPEVSGLVTMLSERPGLVDGSDWPWDLFNGLATQDILASGLTALRRLASAAGIAWVMPAPAGKCIRNLDGQDGWFHYDAPGSKAPLRLEHWRLVFATLPEPKPAFETHVAEDNSELQVRTVIIDVKTGVPLVVSVASEQLIRHTGMRWPLAGGQPAEPSVDDAITPARRSVVVSEVPPQTEEAEPSEDLETPTVRADTVVEEGPEPSETEAVGGGDLPPGNTVDVAQKEWPAGRAWRTIQRKAWEDRRLNWNDNAIDRHYHRFAFLQIDFAEGYEDPKPPEHPLWINGKISPDDLLWPPLKNETRDKADGLVMLCHEEWRRRRVLREVVDACVDFGVSVLVLPEYSMRAETVLWLGQHLENNNLDLSVWAGSFRVPSGFDVLVDRSSMRGQFVSADTSREDTERRRGGEDKWRALQAVIPVIFREKCVVGRSSGDSQESSAKGGQAGETGLPVARLSSELRWRTKRYPAIAYGEDFLPDVGTTRLTPLMHISRSHLRAESYVWELVCSEIFAFNGGVNADLIASNLVTLSRKMGLAKGTKEQFIEQITKDNRLLAAWTSYGLPAENHPRRTVLIMPCVTRRDVDYHSMGVTFQLAAGVNVIFCNSTLHGNGSGGSCVIGFRAWDAKANKDAISGPYHGALPGFYVPADGNNVKPLGDKERALVVVDIDPVNPTQQIPRPQYRPDPVRLVAHLPIVETVGQGYLGSTKVWSGSLHRERSKLEALIEGSCQIVKQHAESTRTLVGSSGSTKDELDELLGKLADLIPSSPMLKQRRKKFFECSTATPQSWPPPVLTDWLEVDLAPAAFKEAIGTMMSPVDPPYPKPDLPIIWIKPAQMDVRTEAPVSTTANSQAS